MVWIVAGIVYFVIAALLLGVWYGAIFEGNPDNENFPVMFFAALLWPVTILLAIGLGIGRAIKTAKEDCQCDTNGCDCG